LDAASLGCCDIGEVLTGLRAGATAFVEETNQLFSRTETSHARVITLDQTRKKIQGLSLQQDELLEQAVRCIEFGVHRAAHVMGWAAFVDLLEEKLRSDRLVKVHGARPAWSKHTTIELIRENVPEFQLVEVARDVGLFGKAEAKSLLRLLAKRNECAHRSGYRFDLNEAIGFVSEIVNRMQRLAKKRPRPNYV
jgi:hypothetical protein